jgi:hypothetical protein
LAWCYEYLFISVFKCFGKSLYIYYEYIFISLNGWREKCQIETEQDLKEKDQKQEDKWGNAKMQLQLKEDLEEADAWVDGGAFKLLFFFSNL